VRFTRRQLREALGCSHTQLRVHLDRLAEMEYLTAYTGGLGRSFVYALAVDATRGAEPAATTATWRGEGSTRRGDGGGVADPLPPNEEAHEHSLCEQPGGVAEGCISGEASPAHRRTHGKPNGAHPVLPLAAAARA
jgi:hypothetical protein